MSTITSNRRLVSDFETTIDKYRLNGSVQMNESGRVVGISGSIVDHTDDQPRQIGQFYLNVDSYGEVEIEKEMIVSGVMSAIGIINSESNSNESE